MSIDQQDQNALMAAERLPADLMLLKMENESIMAVARARPRDPMKIVGQLQQLIDAYPGAADDAIYSKPVGTIMRITCKCGLQYEAPIKWVNRKPVAEPEPCPDCGEWAPKQQDAVKKFAEGLSIRAAESIRSIYGYTRLATTTEMLDDGKVKLTGVLVDYAAGNVTSDERVVSPFYKARGGQMQRTPEDRFLNVIVKAEKAKLRRDVILDNTPNIVKAMFRDACEQKLLGLVAPEVIEQKVLPAFAQYGITPEQLDRIIGKPRALGWKEEDRLELRKILSALKHGETTAADLLAGLDSEPEPEEKPKAGATMEDLAGKKPSEGVTNGKPQETPPKPSTAPADATETGSTSVDAQPPATQQDEQPGESGAASEAEERKPDFAGYTASIQEAGTIDEVDVLEAEAADFLTENELSKLKTTAQNRRIALRFGGKGQAAGKNAKKPTAG